MKSKKFKYLLDYCENRASHPTDATSTYGIVYSTGFNKVKEIKSFKSKTVFVN